MHLTLDSKNSPNEINHLIDGETLVEWLMNQASISSSPSSLVRWRRRGMPHYRISQRCIRYREDEVWAWLCENFRAISITQRAADAAIAIGNQNRGRNLNRRE